LTDTDAVAIATCANALPSTASLVQLLSISTVDPAGRAPEWQVAFFDSATDTMLTGLVTGAPMKLGVLTGNYSECPGVSFTLVSSDVIVPDAFARLSARHVFDLAHASASLFASASCLTSNGAPTIQVYFGTLPDGASEPITKAWVNYDGSGRFLNVCGPCPDPPPPNCPCE
jgi:hypothetical protein